MSRIVALVFAAAAALAGGLHAQQSTITRFEAGGITVIHKPVTANDVIAIRVYLKGGSAALLPANAGIERMLAAMGTHGTSRYGKERFAALMTLTGTNIGSEVSRDYTAYTLQAVRQNWDVAWDLFVQAVLHPALPPEEVENVRRQIADQLNQRRDSPDDHLELLADSALYAGHPYAVDPAGTEATIDAITRDQMIDWHLRRFTKANLLIVVVGNVTRDDIAARVAEAFGGLPARGGEVQPVPPLAGGQADLVTATRDLPTNYIMGMFPAPAPSSPDYPAFRVASRVLSERLFEEIRTRRNLTYAVSAGLDDQAANRANLYVTAVDPDTTVKLMFAEVRRLQDAPVPALRIGESVNVYVTQYLMSQQANMGQAEELGKWELAGGGWQNEAAYLDRLRAVTPAEVQQVARKYYRGGKFVLLGNPAKATRAVFLSL